MDSSGDINVACPVSVGELASSLMWTLLVTQMWPVLIQAVSTPSCDMHSSCDIDMACFVPGCELTSF